jgi:hypothetical protein
VPVLPSKDAVSTIERRAFQGIDDARSIQNHLRDQNFVSDDVQRRPKLTRTKENRPEHAGQVMAFTIRGTRTPVATDIRK